MRVSAIFKGIDTRMFISQRERTRLRQSSDRVAADKYTLEGTSEVIHLLYTNARET